MPVSENSRLKYILKLCELKLCIKGRSPRVIAASLTFLPLSASGGGSGGKVSATPTPSPLAGRGEDLRREHNLSESLQRAH
jgi:hypothetical protein